MAKTSITSFGQSVAATLLQIFETQRDVHCANVLRAADATISFTGAGGWNDEVSLYELVLSIPPVMFAQLESDVGKIAERIELKLGHLKLPVENEELRTARICPLLLAGPGGGAAVAPSGSDVSRIWTIPGAVRMFLSHVSEHREAASKVRSALASMGISAFVAHNDVEPTLEWQKEIETALQSMDVLCALFTPEFRRSRWTDQEVGFALGKNVPVVPVRLGLDPYGFLGKIQAVTGSLAQPEALAANIFDAVLKIEPLRTKVIDALVGAVAEAGTFADAKLGMKKITRQASSLDKTQIERLLRAARDNRQVRDATGVPEQVQQIARKAGVQLKSVASDDFDDDIPF